MTTDKIELLKMWVAALRSGEYAQTRGRLCDEGKYCCMGVGYEVLIKDGHPVKRASLPYRDDEFGYRDDEYIEYINIGLPGSYFNKVFDFPPIAELRIMNDAEEKSFSEIADYIESVVIPRRTNA